VPDRYVRPAIAFVIFASGLKYVGLNTTALGWTLCGVLLAAAVGWLVFSRPWAAAQAQAIVGPLQSEADEPELVTQQRR
jgi:multidrug transporter EmrE-like cation transporter